MSSKGRKNEPWRANERHYCPICNAWMGSDKQSILIHENGKKHRENLERTLQQRRLDKLQQEQEENELTRSLKEVERIAMKAYAKDVASGSFSGGVGESSSGPLAPGHASQKLPLTSTAVAMAAATTSIPTAASTADATATTTTTTTVLPERIPPKKEDKNRTVLHSNKTNEMDSWHARKRKREEGRLTAEGGKEDDSSGRDSHKVQRKQKKLGENEGHYIFGDTTYLEGHVYASIIEEDMPAQIWIGATSANEVEKRSVEKYFYWKTGLVVKVHRRPPPQKVPELDNDLLKHNENFLTFDIAYLKNPTDDDETIEKYVEPNRIRLILGSDDTIPQTIEEARLALLGGEEIVELENNNNTDGNNTPVEIDENTGLSSWTTTTIRRVTVSQEVKEERARLRAKKREEAEREKLLEKEKQARQMEEAKHANADDSALGAYDVWSVGGKSGYKGVDIHTEVKVGVQDTAKSLSKGKGMVGFKKIGGGSEDGKTSSYSLFKKAKKKQNRRRRSTEDD